MVAERTRRAREVQKKAAEEGAVIIANQKTEEPSPEPPPQAAPEKPNYSSLTTTQWLALGILVASLIGLYYKREEIKNAFSPAPPNPLPPSQTPNDRPVMITSRGVRNMN